MQLPTTAAKVRAAALGAVAQLTAAPASNVLRFVNPRGSGFDPAREGDIRSLLIISHIF